ncbi:MAG: HNH endonuclease [Lachnospiraceae bacterium]|nr:HNH endonuclease [Lachnospiraceae bacterium]
MEHLGGGNEISETPESVGGANQEFSRETLDRYDRLMGDDRIENQTEDGENPEISVLTDEERQRKFDKLFESGDFFQNLRGDCSENDSEKIKENIEESNEVTDTAVEKNSRLPRNGGEWTGTAGNSDWIPDEDVIPGDRNGTNPEHKTWDEIKDQYEFEKIPFLDGEPDFSEVSKGQVEIDDFTEDRDANFDQADERLAEQLGCDPEQVAKWRQENRYTWHECRNCSTMQLVPTEVHGNISHSGGISEYKSLQSA